MYINYSISNALHFIHVQQCDYIYQNKFFNVHSTYFVCSTLRVSSIRIYILIQGLLTHNATWCQNRGCICISSVRRTYGRIHIPATIILWTELFPKKRREKIQGENFNLLRVQWCFHKYYKNYKISSNTVYSYKFSSHPVQRNYSTYRINSSSPRNTTTTRLIPCRLLPATAPRAPSNSTRQNPAIRLPTAFQGHTVQAGFQYFYPAETAFYTAASIHAVPTVTPRPVLQFYITEFY